VQLYDIKSLPGETSLVTCFSGQASHRDLLSRAAPHCAVVGAQACISGVVYGLGDLTAQTYEQRSLRDFDAARIARSALCGLLAHGPLSHLYYEKLDRFFILSPVRNTPLRFGSCHAARNVTCKLDVCAPLALLVRHAGRSALVCLQHSQNLPNTCFST
jgi:hypothetical protein